MQMKTMTLFALMSLCVISLFSMVLFSPERLEALEWGVSVLFHQEVDFSHARIMSMRTIGAMGYLAAGGFLLIIELLLMIEEYAQFQVERMRPISVNAKSSD